MTREQRRSYSGGIPTDTDETIRRYFNHEAFELNLTPLRLRIINACKPQ